MTTRREPGAEDDNVLMSSIGPAQDVAKVMETVWVAHGYEDVSGTGPDECVIEFRVVENAKLFKRFRLAGLLALGVTLRHGKNAIESPAEDHARDGRLLLGQEVGDGDQE